MTVGATALSTRSPPTTSETSCRCGSFSTGVTSGHQAPPIVNDGIMFVTTPEAQLLAIDARTGNLLWRYRRQVTEGAVRSHQTNRGVGLWDDKVFYTTHDAFVVALDAVSGDVVWETAVADFRVGYYMTMAPLVAKGKVLVGASGGERGIRGFVAALDADTGREVWRSHTVPGPGEPGNETWPGDTWRTGGASIWVTGSYDPDLNLTFWGTGNPGPWIGDQRPGDNLYTNSVVAFDVDTGELKGYHQYHWNGSWDWDEVSAPLLIDVPRDGRTVKGLVHPARNGYLWLLERTAEGINFIDAGAVRRPERVHVDRPGHRSTRVRLGAKARHQQVCDLLPVAVGREGLAAGCL